MINIHVCGPQDRVFGKTMINTTSRSKDFGRDLSPMVVGPVNVPNRFFAKNVENAWQYSKVYERHLDSSGNPSQKWLEWSEYGYLDNMAQRYPLGKGQIPVYSYWNHQKMDYLTARREIYFTAYRDAVKKTKAWYDLLMLCGKEKEIVLFDFDGYQENLMGFSLSDVLNYEKRPMGHAFILKSMLLLGENVSIHDIEDAFPAKHYFYKGNQYEKGITPTP